jgi:hypothetical protein
MPSLSHLDRGLLLLLPLLVLAAAAASHGDDDDDASYAVSACRSRPYLCGGVNISYPFYLASDTEAVPALAGESYCGYPGLAVSCGGEPVLRLGDVSYAVLRIDYANQVVSLAYADAAAGDDGRCPVVDHNVTIPQDAPARLSLLHSVVDYLLFFVGCSFGPGPGPEAAVPRPPKPRSIKPVTCGDGDLGGAGTAAAASMTFVLPRSEVPPGDWSSACRQVFEAPVLRDSVPSDAQDPLWRSGGYGSALRAGFQLGWDRSSGPCGQCEQSSGGMCGYSRAGEFLGCLCADGRVRDGGCSTISAGPSSALSLSGT